MPKHAPFERHVERYEAWFERHAAVYVSELLALRLAVPVTGRGLEIGVGSGRFAAPLGIEVGLDPSAAMLDRARARGIEVVQGTAEALPFANERFDHVLLVTTLCFLDAPSAMLSEARRVLRPDGRLVIGFIDRGSPPGRAYLALQAENVFYREATFHSATEVARLLEQAGFAIDAWTQTLVGPLDRTRDIEPVRPGCGEGAFVVVTARNAK
jgi:SAM-dependent methyltransferase